MPFFARAADNRNGCHAIRGVGELTRSFADLNRRLLEVVAQPMNVVHFPFGITEGHVVLLIGGVCGRSTPPCL